ncbi:BrnA antitoxin family protein [Oxalobacteraceae bacterium OTU3CINTB1]|nr:BrnA antitoxin family protein [Oxalobacteraceae bacterium OTU3CINTB1]
MKTKPKIILPTKAEDARINAGIAGDPDNPEWSAGDFRQSKSAKEFFDDGTYENLVTLKRRPGERGPQKAAVKERITIRLSPEIVSRFRATGPGWQTRIDDALADWLRTHSTEELKV